MLRAGEVLRKERDALLELVQRLQQQQFEKQHQQPQEQRQGLYELLDGHSHLRISAGGIAGGEGLQGPKARLAAPCSPRKPHAPCAICFWLSFSAPDAAVKKSWQACSLPSARNSEAAS
jgi:hypothetical protein